MKPHRTDPVSLTFGVLFLGAAALWLFTQLFVLHFAAIAMIVAIGLVVVGLVGLILTLTSGRRAGRDGGGNGPDPTPEPPDGDLPGV